ncbi:hypothetical protein B1690_04215 [Geobacillus sp. 46C-IIa]|nr:hypothetical protein B1690_04215 [Geobacillus sp. 46C-IIa]
MLALERVAAIDGLDGHPFSDRKFIDHPRIAKAADAARLCAAERAAKKFVLILDTVLLSVIIFYIITLYFITNQLKGRRGNEKN